MRGRPSHSLLRSLSFREPAAPLPAGFTVNRVGPNFAWDPRADIFYASTMTQPTFKFERAK